MLCDKCELSDDLEIEIDGFEDSMNFYFDQKSQSIGLTMYGAKTLESLLRDYYKKGYERAQFDFKKEQNR